MIKKMAAFYHYYWHVLKWFFWVIWKGLPNRTSWLFFDFAQASEHKEFMRCLKARANSSSLQAWQLWLKVKSIRLFNAKKKSGSKHVETCWTMFYRFLLGDFGMIYSSTQCFGFLSTQRMVKICRNHHPSDQLLLFVAAQLLIHVPQLTRSSQYWIQL